MWSARGPASDHTGSSAIVRSRSNADLAPLVGGSPLEGCSGGNSPIVEASRTGERSPPLGGWVPPRSGVEEADEGYPRYRGARILDAI